jgi:phosphatidylinositol glycan class B
MRAWLQPGLYVLEARALAAAGIQDPFAWALAFRLSSGLMAWLALLSLVSCLPRWLPEPGSLRAATRALCLAWFVPYLAVRTSSESLSGSCYVLGLTLLVRATGSQHAGPRAASALTPLFAGFLLGCAFEFRYAVGVGVAFVLAWAGVVARAAWRRLLVIGSGLALALALGACVDRWGYGAWTLPPVHYFVQNLVEDRAVERFGSLPWYGYFVLATRGPAAPLVLLMLVLGPLAWARWPRHPLTWATAPYAIVHALIAHKELRFLFPLFLLAPVLCVLALAPSADRWDRWLAPIRNHGGVAVRVLAGLNLVALAAFCLIPTRPQLGFQRFALRLMPARFEAYLLQTSSPWITAKLPMNFYRPRQLRLHPAADLGEVERLGLPRFLLITSWCAPPRTFAYACAALYRPLPCWLREVRGVRVDRIPAWDLYRCAASGGPAGLPGPDAVPEAQQGEVHERREDLLARQLGRRAAAVAEVDRHLAEPEAVDPGLVGDLAVDDVALDLDAVELDRLEDRAPVGAIAAGGVAHRDSRHQRHVLVGKP